MIKCIPYSRTFVMSTTFTAFCIAPFHFTYRRSNFYFYFYLQGTEVLLHCISGVFCLNLLKAVSFDHGPKLTPLLTVLNRTVSKKGLLVPVSSDL